MNAMQHVHSFGGDSSMPAIKLPNEPLFATDIDLWPLYLDSFEDSAERQYHNCHACRQFIQRFGGLVTIDKATGETVSAVWDLGGAPESYRKAFAAMKHGAESAKVAGVFLSSDKTLGTPHTGIWSHFAAANPNVYKRVLLTANQAAAERAEDYRNVSRAIGEFKLSAIEQVVELLKSDSLYRSEKVLGQAQWLFDLKSAVTGEKHQVRRKNRVWRAIADAPAGFCHPRSSMIGTLLDDLDAGLSFDDAARKFKAKMQPLQYQRPSAPPSTGAILAAEKMVKDLGVERSLERRFARMADMQALWLPQQQQGDQSGGVFDHLKTQSSAPVAAVAGKITWQKFAAEVLPVARKIDVLLPHGRAGYTTFCGPVDAEAPVIFQWGNAVSWYCWHGGSVPHELRLSPGWVRAKAVCLPPFMWGSDNVTHFGKNAYFILEGAHETKNNGNAIFPETLKSEFHAIRSVIEAHSRRRQIVPIDEPHVVGLGIGCTVRVHTSVVTQYEIDRWD